MLQDAVPPVLVCPAGPDASASVEAARAARLGGDYDNARCTLDRALARDPRSGDAWLELGYLNSMQGRNDAAREAFLRALEIAPDYDDAKLGLAQLAYRSSDLPAARTWLDRIGANGNDSEDVRSLRRAIGDAEKPGATWRWDIFGGYSALSGDLAPWREASVAVSRRDGRVIVGVALDHVQRFGLHDTYGEARLGWHAPYGAWGVAVGGSGDAVFKPEAAVRVEYATPEDRDTRFETALTLARYRVGQVDTLLLRARRQIAAPLNLNVLGVFVRDEADDFRAGYGLGAVWRAQDRLLVDAAWVDAPESSEGATIDVRSATLGVAATFRNDLRVRLGVMREERVAFDRTEVALSLSRTF
jgi:YaiO family outer membrane protein